MSLNCSRNNNSRQSNKKKTNTQNSCNSSALFIAANSLPKEDNLLHKENQDNNHNTNNFDNQSLHNKEKETQTNLISTQEPTKRRKMSIAQVSNSSKITSHSAEVKKRKPKWKRKLDKFLDSPPVLCFMSILTLWALFMSDVQIAWLDIKVDEAFNIIQCCLLGFFAIEFILNCIAKDDYTLGFFFWLDLIATVSIIQDIDYIMDPIMGYEPITQSTTSGSNKNTIKAAKAVQKVSSASRATRVLRVIRIIRLIRMVKLYKSVFIAREQAEKKKAEEKKKMLERLEKDMSDMSSSTISKTGTNQSGLIGDSTRIRKIRSKKFSLRPDLVNHGNEQLDTPSNKEHLSTPGSNGSTNAISSEKEEKKEKPPEQEKKKKENDDDEDEEALIKESRISKEVTESITKKVIVLILALLIIFPLLSDDFYTDDTDTVTYSFLAEFLSNNYQLRGESGMTGNIGDGIYELFDYSFPPINITVNNTVVYTNSNYTNFDFRYKEVKSAYSEDAVVHIVYSVRKETILSGQLNLGQTLFVCLCLTLAALLFEGDATTLVLEPLEVMIEIVEKVAHDPIGAKNVDELQTGIKAAVANIQEGEGDTKNKKKVSKHDDNYEVQVIKSAIIKISALLAIGFGEAGGEIIQKNLSSGQELNPRLKGKKKTAIFGFCDIHDFNEINLALEERTMLFVNEVAEIVHSSVDRFKGATNKNIGDAFLSVWKFYNEVSVKGNNEKNYQRKDNLLEIDPTNPQVKIVADCSVLAFLRIILKINKNLNILAYRNNQEILKRVPNFKLQMGFGLHMGYGIEGAVGSSYKIDASYLSPNVNIAARLESASRQFGVSLLISGVLYEILSDEMKSLCRFVDCVTVKGSVLPLDLYTIDINYNVRPQKESKILIVSNKEKRNIFSEKKAELQALIDEYGSVTEIILEKESFRELIKVRDTNFTDSWTKGIDAYKGGDWKSAKMFFTTCKNIDPEDGPTKTLLNYITGLNLVPPEGWNGVRVLQSK